MILENYNTHRLSLSSANIQFAKTVYYNYNLHNTFYCSIDVIDVFEAFIQQLVHRLFNVYGTDFPCFCLL